MKCFECGGEYIELSGDLELNNEIVGKYIIPNATYKRCEKCGDLILPDKTWEAADKVENLKRKTLLERRSVIEFVSAIEAAEILGITKQALSKNKRIKNGFIFSVQHSGRIEYLRKSLELFKKTGDGRFPLYINAEVLQSAQNETRYIVIQAAHQKEKFREFKGEKNLNKWFEGSSSTGMSTEGRN